jgi:uncharacterized membrane protein (DUF4010 family)
VQEWIKTFHGDYPPFPANEVAVKLAVALALGLLVGFEREWSNKDIGVRTFTMAALLGLLGIYLGTPALLLSGITVLILITFANLRGLQVAQKLETTTSTALVVVFFSGALVGQGHLFTPVACCILVTMLLALKPQLRAFAGGLKAEEVRSALVLGLLSFVILPLLPNRFVDPWQLIQPREDWIIVIVVACLGFLNYVLLRIYGSRGLYLTAVFGGLVNSTATAAEMISTLSSTELTLATPVVLLTSVSMFLRNLAIVAIFAPAAARSAVLPLTAMGMVVGIWVYRDRKSSAMTGRQIVLNVGSPISLRRVSIFALLFLGIQIVATLGQRVMGNAGFQVVSLLGGLFSSASTTAAAAGMALHGKATAMQAGTATVLTSIASTAMNLPIVFHRRKAGSAWRDLIIATLLQAIVGVGILLIEAKFGWF